MSRMKSKIFLLTTLLFSIVLISSCSSDDDGATQTENPTVLHVEKEDGSLFTDGEVVTFNEIGSTDGRDEKGKLKYFLKNVGNEDIKVKIEVAELRGTDGSLFTFCVQPLCIFNVSEGVSYPQNGSVITPNQYNSQDDYFINNDSGNSSTTPIEYDLRFYVEDDNGNQSNDLTITYQYMPN